MGGLLYHFLVAYFQMPQKVRLAIAVLPCVAALVALLFGVFESPQHEMVFYANGLIVEEERYTHGGYIVGGALALLGVFLLCFAGKSKPEKHGYNF